MICKICNQKFSSNRGLARHLRYAHSISSQQYYDIYLKTDGEGICLGCGIPTKFNGLSKGYRKFCSLICCNQSEYHQLKMHNTIVEQYGGMGTASSQINEKIKSTNIKRYGAENLYASEHGKQQIRKTVLERYGVTCASKADSVKQKIVKTSLERYGTSNPGNSLLGRQRAAMTRRNSTNDSSWEDYFEAALIELKINYKKRYKESRYPFYCDFYLPDSDTFIEIQGYWAHNNHFYDSTNKADRYILDKWKAKANEGHKQYKAAISTWTIRDPQKLKYAIDNNLNYITLHYGRLMK